jgi:uncharacterized protein with gpF-like domain
MAKLSKEDLLIAFDKEPEEVLDYFRSLGVVLSDDWSDYLKQFETDAFHIAGINDANHLMDAKDMIDKAITDGTKLKDFIDNIQKDLELRAWHAKLVVTQNISNSYNSGRLIQQLDGTDTFPYLRPVVLLDSKTTNICTWLSKQNLCVRADDPMLKNMYSPRHFRCRTIWVAITEKQMERMGLKVIAIKDIDPSHWNNKDFRRLPNSGFKPDLSQYPAALNKQIKMRFK